MVAALELPPPPKPPPTLILPEEDNTPSAIDIVLASLPLVPRPDTINKILDATKIFQERDEIDIDPNAIDLEVDFLSRSFSWLERALNIKTYARNMRTSSDDENSIPPHIHALQSLLLKMMCDQSDLLIVLRKLEYFGRRHKDAFGEVGGEAGRLLEVCDALIAERKRQEDEAQASLKERRDRAMRAWEEQHAAYLQELETQRLKQEAPRSPAPKAPAAPPPPPPPRSSAAAPPPPAGTRRMT